MIRTILQGPEWSPFFLKPAGKDQKYPPIRRYKICPETKQIISCLFGAVHGKDFPLGRFVIFPFAAGRSCVEAALLDQSISAIFRISLAPPEEGKKIGRFGISGAGDP